VVYIFFYIYLLYQCPITTEIATCLAVNAAAAKKIILMDTASKVVTEITNIIMNIIMNIMNTNITTEAVATNVAKRDAKRNVVVLAATNVRNIHLDAAILAYHVTKNVLALNDAANHVLDDVNQKLNS